MNLKQPTTLTLILLVLTAIFSHPARSVEINSRPILQTLPDGNYTFCSIPSLESAQGEAYMIENDAICYWFSKRGKKLAGLVASARAQGEDAICVEGQVNRSTIVGRAVYLVNQQLPQSRSNPEAMGNAIVSYWLSKRPRVLWLAQVTYRNEKKLPYITFGKAQLKLDGFYRYRVGSRLPPKSCSL